MTADILVSSDNPLRWIVRFALNPISFFMLRAFSLILLLPILASTPSRAGTLYATDFDSFPAGDNLWAGTQGWLSNNNTGGVQGILQDPVKDLPLGKAAFIGFNTPAAALTVVYRPMNFDPVASGQPRVEFQSLLGVQDSTNGRRDRFHLTFYNIGGDFLAALTFDNTNARVLSDDGSTVRDSGVTFLKGDPLLGLAALQLLHVGIDFHLNRWSASLDGVPLFDRTFTVTGKPLTLGTVAVEWEIPSGSPALAGNNWLLVADWLLASIPPGPFQLLGVARDAVGTATVTWPGHPGFDYQVEDSTDLVAWGKALPGSKISANPTEGVLSFSDPTAATRSKRFYRVVRTPAT
jgi:hypothetical protein